ncbi:MAG: reverse transcriptase/maturase family protein [Parcubacteria group bacterium]
MFEDIAKVENLFKAWREFAKGKRYKRDVQEFQLNLADNIFDLYIDLVNYTYCHGSYQGFKINDPKPRDIHKARVRDRLLHHAVYRILYPFFDKKFIADSYSCRNKNGTHKAMNRFRTFAYKVSRNDTRTCWILKCDIRKFFASINHDILKRILASHINDKDTLWLLSQVIDSFNPGLPLGNLTSQLLVNIYMNEFDQFLKHKLGVRYYIRYADDFILLHYSKQYLENMLPKISEFLMKQLKLNLHPDKVFIKTIVSGIDFLGWVHFPDHRVLRTSMKRRMLRRLTGARDQQTVNSYLGLLKHGNAYGIRNRVVCEFLS